MLKRRVAARPAVDAVDRRSLLVAAHAPAVERAVRVAAEHAGLLQLGEKTLDLRDPAADQIGELRRRHRPAVDKQRPMRARLVHQAQHLDPQPPRGERTHAQGGVGAPVGREEFEPGLFNDISKKLGAQILLPLVGEGGPT